MKILISDPDSTWANQVFNKLGQHSMSPQICENGKDCQLKAYKDDVDAVILDLATSQNTALEVLKYLKLNYPRVKIVFTVANHKKLADLGLDKDGLKHLGVSEVLIKPYSLDVLLKSIENDPGLASWKSAIGTETVSAGEEKEINARDEEFTHVKISEFCSGNHAIFDHYIRLSAGKFLKILHKGEKLDRERLRHYVEDKKVEFLYFKTKDRGTYVNFINEVLQKAINSGHSTGNEVKLVRSAAEKYVDEVYTAGLKPQLIEEGIKMCHNIYQLIQKDARLTDTLAQYIEYDPPVQTHLFLTSFFSTLICKSLDWTTIRTVEIIAMASLLHDIGKLKFPPVLRQIAPAAMNEEQRKIYQQHPLWGVQLLEKSPLISEAIKQTVYQHHETIDGEGFPNRLSGNRIYPMAKIVGLANWYSNILINNKISPLEGLRKMLEDETFAQKYEPQIVKALFMGFAKEKIK